MGIARTPLWGPMHLMRLSLMKAAHAVVGESLWQKIGVRKDPK